MTSQASTFSQTIAGAPRRFLVFALDRPDAAVAVQGRSFAEAAGAFLETGASDAQAGEVHVAVLDPSSGRREEFVLDVA